MLPHALSVSRKALVRLIGAVAALTAPTLVWAEQATVVAGPPTPAPAKPSHITSFTYRGEQPRGATDGVGVFATTRAATVDLTAPDQVVDGPNGSLFNEAAGVGWRARNVSAMVGYMKPSSVRSATQFRSDDYTPTYKTRAHFGVAWALHF